MLTKGLVAPVQYRKFTISAADIAALGANTSGNIALFTLPAFAQILGIVVKHTAQFVVGSGTFKVSVGSAVNATLLTVASADLVATAVADTTYQKTASPDQGTMAELALVLNAVSSVGNLSTCSAGSVDIAVLFTAVSTPTP